MGLFQSYSQVFVTNSPAILAQGQTVDALAIGQIGFLDAKTYTAVTAPTYAKNKALYAVWGTPDVDLGDFGGVPNENEYSKLIKGKLIRRVRAHKAQHPQTPVYTIGWSGDVSDTDTLFANPGERKSLFIKLSGTIIERLYSKQGFTKQFIANPPCETDCDTGCAPLDCRTLVQQYVDQINTDKDFRKFIRAKALIACTPDPSVSTTTVYKFALSVCDTGDDVALGLVQAAYPAEVVVRTGRKGAISTYGVVKAANSAPADFTNTIVLVPDCATCPEDYTFTAAANVYQIKTPNGTTSGNVASAFTGEITISQLNVDPEFVTYIVTFPTSTADSTIQTAAGTAGYIATKIGLERGICTQDTPSTATWVADGTLLTQSKDYRITLADSICGTNRLADLQAAYPSLVITVVDSAGSCVHTYETSVDSNVYADGCAIDLIKFTAPAMFEGAEWKEVVPAADGATCKCGIQIETAFFNRTTNECTFDAFPYENDIVHVQASNYNPDFNASPCEGQWVFKQIRQVKFPKGHGRYIQKLEQESKAYDQRFRNTNPVVREVQGYSFQAQADKYYDEYVLEFDTVWKTSGGWSEDYKQSFNLSFFVPEGTGSQIEAALNSYATSAGVEEIGAAI